jgi:hypothetical protein
MVSRFDVDGRIKGVIGRERVQNQAGETCLCFRGQAMFRETANEAPRITFYDPCSFWPASLRASIDCRVIALFWRVCVVS